MDSEARREFEGGPSRVLPNLLPWLLMALAIVVGGRAIVILQTNVFTDEAIYLWMAYHTPTVFVPHPPGSTVLGRLGVALLGHNEAGVRLFSFLLMFGLLFPTYALTRRLGGGVWAARWAVLAVLATPIYGAFGSLLTPDAPQLFVWAILLWSTHRALCTGRVRDWAMCGVVLGVGLFIKYILILYVPALALVLFATRRGRSQLRSPGPWYALGLAALLIGPPALIKEHSMGWPTVRYHLRDRQTRVAPSPKLLGIYYGGHFLYYSPVLYLMALGAIAGSGVVTLRGRREARVEGRDTVQQDAERHEEAGEFQFPSREASTFLFAFSAVPFLFFGCIAMVTRRELSREHWDAIAYPPAYIAAGLWLERRLSLRLRGAAAWKVGALAGPVVGLLLFAGVVMEVTTGSITGAFGVETPVNNLYGWKKMAILADAEVAKMPNPDGHAKPFFLGNSFAEMMTYDFYGKAMGSASCLDHKENHSYGLVTLLDLRRVGQEQLVEKYGAGANAVFVDVNGYERPRRNEDASSVTARMARDRTKAYWRLMHLFERVEPADPSQFVLGGRPILNYTMFRCYGLRPSYL